MCTSYNIKFIEKKKIINQSINNKLRYILISKLPKLCLFVNYIGPTSSYIFYNKNYQYDQKLNWLIDMDLFYRVISKKNCELIPIVVNTQIKKRSITNLNIKNKYITELKEYLYFKKKYQINIIKFILYYLFSIIFRVYLKFSNLLLIKN